MTILTADELADTHQYLAHALPDWRHSMSWIRNRGGPWPCDICGGPSYLDYRCSKCGSDLASGGQTTGRQS